jgi:hypothetical protein
MHSLAPRRHHRATGRTRWESAPPRLPSRTLRTPSEPTRNGLVTHSRLSDFRPPELSDFHPALTLSSGLPPLLPPCRITRVRSSHQRGGAGFARSWASRFTHKPQAAVPCYSPRYCSASSPAKKRAPVNVVVAGASLRYGPGLIRTADLTLISSAKQRCPAPAGARIFAGFGASQRRQAPVSASRRRSPPASARTKGACLGHCSLLPKNRPSIAQHAETFPLDPKNGHRRRASMSSTLHPHSAADARPPTMSVGWSDELPPLKRGLTHATLVLGVKLSTDCDSSGPRARIL